MDSNQKKSQSVQGSRIDDSKNEAKKAVANAEREDDFLSGDNAKKTAPKNPNIGGNESEYENSTSDADQYAEDSIADNTEGFANRRDNEEVERHLDEDRYSSPTTRNRAEEW
ncbi:hypothetical protein [Flavobacterium wongokense]|uniref:hypothetical protein n=1 Tax=Flavobacterium wongokense TaxID=2910674 RepID=UPI001F182476|nr:hypothetical protein [Flavobacterium sp. WG47]MCF6132240.1 hypothetical protein [Flavobacterium sp. WG47]